MRDEVLDPQRAASLGPVIEYAELNLTDVIGEGAFGSVRKGEWNLMPVAVKILHKSDPKATQMFYKEVELFKYVLALLSVMVILSCIVYPPHPLHYSKIRHKHIARYLGSCIRPPLCMVCVLDDCLIGPFVRIAYFGCAGDGVLPRVVDESHRWQAFGDSHFAHDRTRRRTSSLAPSFAQNHPQGHQTLQYPGAFSSRSLHLA